MSNATAATRATQAARAMDKAPRSTTRRSRATNAVAASSLDQPSVPTRFHPLSRVLAARFPEGPGCGRCGSGGRIRGVRARRTPPTEILYLDRHLPPSSFFHTSAIVTHNPSSMFSSPGALPARIADAHLGVLATMRGHSRGQEARFIWSPVRSERTLEHMAPSYKQPTKIDSLTRLSR